MPAAAMSSAVSDVPVNLTNSAYLIGGEEGRAVWTRKCPPVQLFVDARLAVSGATFKHARPARDTNHFDESRVEEIYRDRIPIDRLRLPGFDFRL
jgi:hypothetical protein